ncbi:thioredoxin family protein [Bacillus sp. FJAT-22090]|uniref:thioredoxin family protein n=1 Tax=Bacillus sp. FJAT-22090 TaxID=1581038 RepID=UPI0011A60B77|nr:thioredoxin family protein [Bacillus sp. FJAT-22090]
MNEWSKEQWEQFRNSKQLSLFYLYTPMCGTCKVASKMLHVINEMVSYPVGQANINFIESLAMEYEIESVPCLLIAKSGKVYKKIYAFQSVPYLLETIKGIDDQVVV